MRRGHDCLSPFVGSLTLIQLNILTPCIEHSWRSLGIRCLVWERATWSIEIWLTIFLICRWQTHNHRSMFTNSRKLTGLYRLPEAPYSNAAANIPWTRLGHLVLTPTGQRVVTRCSVVCFPFHFCVVCRNFKLGLFRSNSTANESPHSVWHIEVSIQKNGLNKR